MHEMAKACLSGEVDMVVGCVIPSNPKERNILVVNPDDFRGGIGYLVHQKLLSMCFLRLSLINIQDQLLNLEEKGCTVGGFTLPDFCLRG